jgi:acetyl-CoA/propionyl-CoA carboxylase biotin carboxyl carrier protein
VGRVPDVSGGALFQSVLVANRGEIAVRVMRTLARLGTRSIAVYSDADAGALHTRTADTAVRIGPAAAAQSYLSVDAVIDAALRTGAQAIHPGYGFLSENPALARACGEHGIVFVGPPVAAIEAMGDKIAAKARVAAAGVPVVPGSSGAGLSDADLTAAAASIGFPVLIKPSAGGGGKGMRLVERADELAAAIDSARREARSSFGDDTLLVERFLPNPRHIEIQVLADTHGQVVHLGERECSLQRRHQKIVEECPSVLLDADGRAEMGRQAVEAARSCGYAGAGTVEFIVGGDRPEEFFFMEMNTRLQVEHPVTEMVYGVDLVEHQLRVAAGLPLELEQAALQPAGHAIEARVYAEDPARGFLPTGGTVERWRAPSGDGVRVDSGIDAGSVVSSDYDPMLAKVVAWGDDRGVALRRLDAALASTTVLGVTTNIGFLRRLLADPGVIAGTIDTGLVERNLGVLTAAEPPAAALVVAALLPLIGTPGAGDDLWSTRTGWRLGRPAVIERRLEVGERSIAVGVTYAGSHGRWSITVPARQAALDVVVSRIDEGRVTLSLDGTPAIVEYAHHAGAATLVSGGESWSITESAVRRRSGSGAAGADDGAVRSPMPGTVIAVHVGDGAAVAAGQPLAVVEAMKMEHTVNAPFDGTVTNVRAIAGAAVALDEVLLTIERSEVTEES